jgi:hypothetical protein
MSRYFSQMWWKFFAANQKGSRAEWQANFGPLTSGVDGLTLYSGGRTKPDLSGPNIRVRFFDNQIDLFHVEHSAIADQGFSRERTRYHSSGPLGGQRGRVIWLKSLRSGYFQETACRLV